MGGNNTLSSIKINGRMLSALISVDSKTANLYRLAKEKYGDDIIDTPKRLIFAMSFIQRLAKDPENAEALADEKRFADLNEAASPAISVKFKTFLHGKINLLLDYSSDEEKAARQELQMIARDKRIKEKAERKAEQEVKRAAAEERAKSKVEKKAEEARLWDNLSEADKAVIMTARAEKKEAKRAGKLNTKPTKTKGVIDRRRERLTEKRKAISGDVKNYEQLTLEFNFAHVIQMLITGKGEIFDLIEPVVRGNRTFYHGFYCNNKGCLLIGANMVNLISTNDAGDSKTWKSLAPYYATNLAVSGGQLFDLDEEICFGRETYKYGIKYQNKCFLVDDRTAEQIKQITWKKRLANESSAVICKTLLERYGYQADRHALISFAHHIISGASSRDDRVSSGFHGLSTVLCDSSEDEIARKDAFLQLVDKIRCSNEGIFIGKTINGLRDKYPLIGKNLTELIHQITAEQVALKPVSGVLLCCALVEQWGATNQPHSNLADDHDNPAPSFNR